MLFDGVPPELLQLLDDPGMDRKSTTFCLWRTADAVAWSQGAVVIPQGFDDGRDELLSLLHPKAAAHKQWAEDYYEREFALADVEMLYSHEWSEAQVLRLKPGGDVDRIAGEMQKLKFKQIEE